ncbi:Gfo/Idh/MocA family oxidoreductase [Paenibacillus sp. MMS20-IR301]|uniref:Gfo/Idh/MocA family protein n=1 Tax=Paenibacillus sp. MMS20-IR301 TaxID=2895946 RepID=UPI0028E75F0C|nr:Gfo/Idh/MocA family oxidoreductase [Paenibacillus sp. MMS20-IR301]WNS45292.1 Gfo/Idh/MocA family oxidoreductase [Paenibacillus sp. MMS20-IR301]
MRLGIAGAGNIVKDLLSFVGEIPGISLSAICSRPGREEALQRLQAQHGISRIYTDYSAMLQDVEVDTVYVAVPNHLHYSYTKDALLGGKHVICEKPFTSSLQELQELEQLAKERELILLEAISNQYLVNAALLKEHLSGLGVIKMVSCNYSQYSSRYDAFKQGVVLPAFDPLMSGGALMDINIYNIHLIVGCFGSPQKVEYRANIERGIDTSGLLLLDYGDFHCACIGAKDSSAVSSVNIQGTEGYIYMAGSANVCDAFEYAAHQQKPVRVDRKDHPHRMYDEFLAFEQMIAEQDHPQAAERLAHSERVMMVVEQAKRSAGLVFGKDCKN